ncbi:MAG: hypothetical protein AAGN46_11810 [Acidobacteriota bacterium]
MGRSTPLWLSILLWITAVALMFSAAVYQRATGPTYPARGELTLGGETVRYALIRSENTTTDARVFVPAPDVATRGAVYFRRFKTADPFRALPMAREGGELAAGLPAQPAAGKLEYYLVLENGDEQVRIPRLEGVAEAEAEAASEGSSDENIVIRFKDPVPGPLLWSHVAFMFFSVLIGMRTGLSALFAPTGMRLLAWITFVGLTIGGMILGPFVQKHAFGEYWTGFPWGYDLTDNKMLIMWIAWLIACSTIGLRERRDEGLGTPSRRKANVGRAVVFVAALVMTGVYLIPHSMRGSELDYSKVDQGVPASEAIGTGD